MNSKIKILNLQIQIPQFLNLQIVFPKFLNIQIMFPQFLNLQIMFPKFLNLLIMFPKFLNLQILFRKFCSPKYWFPNSESQNQNSETQKFRITKIINLKVFPKFIISQNFAKIPESPNQNYKS